MSICLQFEERVIAEAAGNLENAERPALEAHLEECGACRARLASERRLFASIDAGVVAMVVGEPAPEFAANVMAQLTGEAEQKLLAAIDAGVAHTVAAEPSPIFAAAVRARIASEPAPKPAWFSFGWGGLAAGALAGVALLVVLMSPEPTPVVNNGPPAPPVNRVPVNQAPTLIQQVAHVRRVTPRPKAPEVLILDSERQSVARFYRFVQEGRINTAHVLEANRIELAVRLEELKTPALLAASSSVKTLDLVDAPRSTSDHR